MAAKQEKPLTSLLLFFLKRHLVELYFNDLVKGYVLMLA